LAVANAISPDRRVLKKYGLDVDIANAAKRQAKAAKSGNSAKRRSVENRIAASQASNEQLAAQANALLAQLALIEGKAKRLGINPEELYRPLVPPDRRLPNIFGNKEDRTRHTVDVSRR
jgi:type II secretory pathway component PulL